jgi:hypothetical protein
MKGSIPRYCRMTNRESTAEVHRHIGVSCPESPGIKRSARNHGTGAKVQRSDRNETTGAVKEDIEIAANQVARRVISIVGNRVRERSRWRENSRRSSIPLQAPRSHHFGVEKGCSRPGQRIKGRKNEHPQDPEIANSRILLAN